MTQPMTEQQTAVEAIDEMQAFKRRGWEWPCTHPHLDEDGVCRRCGADKRGFGE